MLLDFLIGSAIFMAFFILWGVGLFFISKYLNSRLGDDEKRKTRVFRFAFGIWMFVLAGLFAFVGGTDWGQPIAILTPLVVICGAGLGIEALLRGWRSPTE
jgi:peptidoglycan/LPS O-acetylase OafA/YrhL